MRRKSLKRRGMNGAGGTEHAEETNGRGSKGGRWPMLGDAVMQVANS